MEGVSVKRVDIANAVMAIGAGTAMIGSILGGIFWVSTTFAEQKAVAARQERIVTAFTDRIDKVEVKQDRYNANLTELNGRLSNIEGYMKALSEGKK